MQRKRTIRTGELVLKVQACSKEEISTYLDVLAETHMILDTNTIKPNDRSNGFHQFVTVTPNFTEVDK